MNAWFRIHVKQQKSHTTYILRSYPTEPVDKSAVMLKSFIIPQNIFNYFLMNSMILVCPSCSHCISSRLLRCALCLQPEGSFSLTVTWTPTEEGGTRQIIIFNANGVIKHQAVLLGRAEAPKKKKVDILSWKRRLLLLQTHSNAWCHALCWQRKFSHLC